MRSQLNSYFLFFIILFFALPTLSSGAENFPYFDDFENESTTASWDPVDDYWIWDNVGTSMAHSDSMVWSCGTESSNHYLILTDTVDLSTADSRNPYFSFWRRSDNGGGIYYYVYASSNGGINWTRVNNSSGQYFTSTTEWQRFQYSLYNFRSDKVLIRFQHNMYNANTKLLIDDFEIDNAPEPTNISASDPTNNGMTLTWEQSTAADFDHYTLVVSTSTDLAYSSSTYNSISGRNETWVIDIDTKTDTVLTMSRSQFPLAFAGRQYYAKVYETDTQGYTNQGTAACSLYTANDMTAINIPGSEDFESGSHGFRADYPWAVTDLDNGQSGHSSTFAMEDSPDGENYATNTDRWLVTKWVVPTTPLNCPILSFNHKFYFASGDVGYLDYSLNNSNWTAIDRFEGYQENWETVTMSLTDLQQNSNADPVYLRFRTTSNSSTEADGWHIDDFSITETSGTTTGFPYYEDFEDPADVAGKYALGYWEVYETNNALSGNHVLAQRRMQPSVYQYFTLGHTLDLSETNNPYLQFNVRSATGGGTYFYVYASTNGGRTWTRINNESGTYFTSSENWSRLQFTLEPYRSENFMLKFCYSYYNGVPLWIDDLVIDEAPEARSITLSDPTNNGFTATWDRSTASDFDQYRLLVSTNSGYLTYSSSTFNTVSGRNQTICLTFDDINDTTYTFHRDSTIPINFVNKLYYAKVFEIDTQGLINEGTAVESIVTAYDFDTEQAPFVEDFDSTEVAVWAAEWPWAISNTKNGIGEHSYPNSYECSPGSDYANNSDYYIYTKWLLPSSLTIPIIKFNYFHRFASSDVGYFDYSLNNSSWTTLMRFEGESDPDGEWSHAEFNGSFLRANSENEPVYFRFRVTSNSSTTDDGLYFDDFTVQQTERSKLTYPFDDDVEDSTETHQKWVPGEWMRFYTADAHSGSYVWRSPYKSNVHYPLTFGSTIDLMDVANPYLSFWIRNSGSGGTYFYVYASTDAGRNWTRINTVSGTYYYYGITWKQITLPLSSYRSENTMIRIDYSMYNGVYFYVDDILIINSPTLVAPDNNAENVPVWLDFEWTESDISTSYQVQVSDDSEFSNIVLDDGEINTTTYRNSSSFTVSTDYWWRVRGLNDTTGWATAFQFTTSASVLEAPTLIRPDEGATDVSSSSSFTWSEIDEADSYRILVSIDRGFNTTVIDSVVTDTTLATDGVLQGGTTYYWRVRAHAEADTSIYSRTNIFSIATGECGAVNKNVEVTVKMHGFWDGDNHAELPVTLELRSGATLMASTLEQRKPGVIDTNGRVTVNFCSQSDGNYWLVVRSAGFLPLGSTSKIALSTTKATYDFTNASTKAAGGERALYDDSGTWLMRSGELSGDRRVSASDNSNMILHQGRSLQDVVPER